MILAGLLHSPSGDMIHGTPSTADALWLLLGFFGPTLVVLAVIAARRALEDFRDRRALERWARAYRRQIESER